ncbi:MAG: hypothetical protein COB67_00320 [SAR324 cluster bacterium]|uniref:Uncharacterized protein n=1 Tax=SAR324 cluster bacterium TaxID=2024889 RepID=A0A2A4TC40_9DELT|nr:MAG: hypothetical protein COB67_00320 [SAR324 cluster bacterium]
MKILIVLMVLITSIFAIKDLGVHGTLYKINESPLIATIKKEISELDIEKLKADLFKKAQAAFIRNHAFNECEEDDNSRYKNFIFAPQDVKNVDGSYLIKKGQRINVNLPIGVIDDICFVDGTDLNISLSNMTRLDNAVKCRIYSIANRDVRDYKDYGYDLNKVVPFDITTWNLFNLDCAPTLLHLEKNYVDIYKFKAEEEE